MLSKEAELSVSATGIHIIVRGKIDRSFRNDSIGLEVYDSSRYFTFTGDILNDRGEIHEEQEGLDILYYKYNKRDNETNDCNRLIPPVNKAERVQELTNGNIQEIFFFARLVIIPFNSKVSKIDPFFKDKLEAEIDGVFYWALQGLYRIINNNFNISVNIVIRI